MVDSKVIPKHCQNDFEKRFQIDCKKSSKRFQNYFGPITVITLCLFQIDSKTILLTNGQNDSKAIPKSFPFFAVEAEYIRILAASVPFRGEQCL